MSEKLVRLTKLYLSAPGESPCAVRRLEPVTAGLPFPRGSVSTPSALVLLDMSDRRLPLQVRVLDRWPDGSVRWALLDFQASVSPDTGRAYTLALDPSGGPRAAGPLTAFSDGDGRLTVDTGAARFVLKPGRASVFQVGSQALGPILDPEGTRFRVIDRRGRDCILEFTMPFVEEAGSLRTVVRAEGVVRRADGARDLHITAGLHFYAGSAAVRFDVTVLNPHRAQHPGGIWTLGDAGSIQISEVSLDFALPPSSDRCEVLCSPELGAPLQHCDNHLELYQESSAGPNWRSHNHVNRNGVVPFSMKGYRLHTALPESQGLRATPIVILRDREHVLGFAMRHFWQNFPKAVKAGDRTITVSLFPGEFPDLHEIQGGEQKTYTFVAAFGSDRTTELPLEWCRTPLLAHADPGWYASTGAIPYLTPASEDPNTDYVGLVNAAIEGDDTFERKREVIDEYGWRNFGDLYADHESVFHTGAEPLVSHYNNQYDAIAGFACQFLRSADRRWWTRMDELARHVIDIDIYHTDRDRAAFNHGLFWHTFHYRDAGTSTHRAYPRAPGVNGGGLSNEHNYTTGLTLHHLLTGDMSSREAVIGFARWVINMDDGRRSALRWLDRGFTGFASITATVGFHGPGRGAGNSINALLDGHRLTGENRFLEKAEQLIRRCIHPADNIAARELLDPERRWSYTVFLRALGKYLEYKHERNELDRMYAYARASLLHYARWMVSNERPYLDKPEILEYPTETWPALDMKKSEVFMVAARHADGEERLKLLERAGFFFRYSVSTLRESKTRALTRPLVLMLSHGLMWAWFQRAPDAALSAPPAAPQDFGVPHRFVAQKDRAKRRAAALLAVAAALVLGIVTLAVLR